MNAAINAWTFPPQTPPLSKSRWAATAGFAGCELVVSDEGPLRPDPCERVCAARPARRQPRRAHRRPRDGLFWRFNYAAPTRADRQRAHELTLQLLDRAAAAQAGAVLVVPAVVGKAGDPRPGVTYSDALLRTYDALAELRFAAEARAVVLALENVWNRFLLSPVEAADLLDRINSPYVGFYLDTGNLLPYGYPEDWIATLGGRIARVHAKDYDLQRPGPAGFCPLGSGSVNWPAVVRALAACGYDGPLTYEGPGDPGEVCRRLKNILAGRPACEVQA
jgi:hexulose-6-phosphate isomerase